MASLGSRINEYRRRRNITQEQLAEAMGVSAQAVSKWENDISCPDISLLPQLSDYFGVGLDTLLRGDQGHRVQVLEEGQRKDFNRMAVRMIVNSARGDVVRINLPLVLIKAGIELGMPMSQSFQFGQSDTVSNTMRQIDFNALIKLAESGMIGKLMEVTSAEGDVVEVFID